MKNKVLPLVVILFVSLGIFLGFSIVDDDPNISRTQEPVQFESIPLTPPHYVAPDAIIFEDSLNGANDTTALKSRGYLPFYRGNGPQGTVATWFQGNSTVFPAFNGPTSGYVAANYQVVGGANNIDSWLILPVTPVGAGDTLSFYQRSTASTTYRDSMRVMYSAVGSTTPEGTWVELGRFWVTNGTWTQKIFTAPTPGPAGRFALRYCVVNGGPSGSNSDYMGVDWIRVYGSGAGPTTCNYIAGSWCPAGTIPNLPSASIYAAAAWLGDTLYFHAPNNGSSSTTVRKYTWGGTWSLGTPLPAAKTYGAMTECNGKLYFIGGGTSSSGGNKTYEYDAGTGAWTTKANLPINRAGHGLVNWGDSVIFCVGGPWSSTPSTGRHVYYYRPAANTWGTLTNSLPAAAARRAFSIGLIDNKIIIAAGYQSGGSGFLKSTYIGTIGSDATQLTWVAGPNVPTPCTGLSRSGGTAYGDFFFCVGGECGGPGGSTNITYVYSLSSNSWFGTIAPMPHAFHNISNQVVPICVDDTARIMIVGGYSSPSYTSFVDVTGCGPILVNIKPTAEIPKSYDLSQNYPNPFNPTTKISYTIPKTGLVILKVYDILGKEIATLVNEVKNTGSYIIEFNGSNLSSGTYFYRLQADDFVSIKKMMFIK